ncbi:MAG: VTT domain-containing protein [Candidatus Methanofastidiosa archaeon]|nr:VTT domain-containing protein [Candidatus Methanofastidiosa archaeon]
MEGNVFMILGLKNSRLKYILILFFIIFTTILISLWQTELQKFANYGYVGIFTACFIANSTVFLPAPSSAIVFTFSAIYPPFFVAMVGGLGATLGEVIGYFAGFSGRKIINSSPQGQTSKCYINKYGALSILLFAFLPLPIFDLVGVTAGATRMKFYIFFLACLLGKLIKMFIYAFAGAGILPMLFPYIKFVLN